MKDILVAFSGGLDSTALVYENLKKGNRVRGLYVEIKNNTDKVLVEKHQVEKIVKLFEAEFPDQFRLDMGSEIYVHYTSGIKFAQISFWLFALLYHGCGNYSEVHIGAVMNDDMVSFIDDIQGIWEAYGWLNEKEHPPLLFPFTKKSKFELVELLPKEYRELVVFCEDPNIIKKPKGRSKKLEFVRCGRCHSCKRYEFDSHNFRMEYGQIKTYDDYLKENESHFNELTAGAEEVQDVQNVKKVPDLEPVKPHIK